MISYYSDASIFELFYAAPLVITFALTFVIAIASFTWDKEASKALDPLGVLMIIPIVNILSVLIALKIIFDSLHKTSKKD